MTPPANKSKNNSEKRILRTVRDTIARYMMFAAGDSVLMAVSGGPDSVTLAHILHTIAGEYPIRLGVAHLNHCLRGRESERDAEFVAALAGKLDLPFYIEKKDVCAVQRRRHLSPEEAARQVRYAFYGAVASKNGFSKIALGHHSDDNAELVLMNLLRGSGPLGLSGIAPVRENKFVRPIIGLKQSEILSYIAEKKIAFVSDASNTDTAYRRNQIRHQLIPELKKSYNPAIVASLNRLGEILQAEDRWMDKALEPAFGECLLSRSSHQISLSLTGINGMDLAAKRRIIRKAIFRVKQNLRRITFLHVDSIIGLARKGQACGSLDLPGGVRVIKNAAALTFKKENRPSTDHLSEYRYTIAGEGITPIKEAGAVIKLSKIEINKVPDFKEADKRRAFLDWDCMQFPLVVRNFRPGDRFSPLGMAGTQKLKKFFSNNKIPVRQRKICPLVLSENKIIWVAGHRIDNSVKLGPQTQRVLMAELLLA